ncbi:tetratricopeptide repeat protein [Kordiimonas laminariae]|uniref:tetratricopeptide repeat protein n=1 Tax=Kordiimonas laminariae TaxID=2917717 RepID=UPI001FF22768|nr:hypothetical protein [Kordiimonas laminariae]MCK0070275.1 hypothetical protein [Kordiimonas laminariae]
MIKSTLLAAAILFGAISEDDMLQTSVDMQSVEDALEMMRGGDIKGGVAMLESLAMTGNALAYYHLAEVRRIGVGTEKNIPVATMFYRLSSQLGHEEAALKLANILFFEGGGTDSEVAEAVSLWQSEAMKGVPEALYMMGMIYWNGEAGFEQDPIRGYGLVWRASRDGYLEAGDSLGTMSVLLERKAKDVGQRYAERLEELGFDEEALAPHLLPVVDSADTRKKRADNALTAAEILDREATAKETVAAEPAPAEEAVQEKETDVTANQEGKAAPKPEDWDEVWHLEVGFAMSELEVKRLRSIVSSTLQQEVGNLHSDIVESPNRPGLYRLVFGPVTSLQSAVTKCVAMKRAGHDCFAKAPQKDDDDLPGIP